MTSIEIVGAGLAGLLAGNLLARRGIAVYESQPTLPNNHSAVLRFQSGAVGDAVGIPFRSVKMIKGALEWKNPVADALTYSFKNTGMRRSDRSITQGLVSEQRYIAPPNLVELLANNIGPALILGTTAKFDGPNPYISTIPMPDLARVLDYPYQDDVKFHTKPGINIRAVMRGCDAYVSLLVPDPQYAFTRISLTGDELIVEIPGTEYNADDAFVAARLLGFVDNDVLSVTAYESKYQKILPINERARRNFLYWATDEKGIYSLGRYATARPGLLLDSLLQDIRLISGWIDAGHYEMRKMRIGHE